MGIFGSIVTGTAKSAKGFRMAPFKALRRIVRTAFDTVVSIPARVGRTATLGTVSGRASAPIVGSALIVFVATWLGVV